MSFKSRGTRRTVKRVRSQIVELFAATQGEVVIHNVDEDRTLIRTIIDLDIIAIDNSIANTYAMALTMAPRGVNVTPGMVDNATTLDVDVMKQELWFKNGELPSGFIGVREILRDIKSMRKLRAATEIKFVFKAETAGDLEVAGTIIQFFKET